MDEPSTAYFVSFLSSDLSIRCTDSRSISAAHERIKRFSWPFVFLWPLGVPLCYVYLLVRCRKSIVTKEPDKLSKAISFLYAEYCPEYFWWEVADLLRKIVLIGWLLLLEERLALLRLVSSLLISLLYLLLVAILSPYKRRDNNIIAVAGHLGAPELRRDCTDWSDCADCSDCANSASDRPDERFVRLCMSLRDGTLRYMPRRARSPVAPVAPI